MKKQLFALMLAFFMAMSISLFTSCDDDESTTDDEKTENTITENISTNTTWKTGETYILAERIVVLSGVTLTIEPGVVVKGEAGTGVNATALIIAQGAKIDAKGTASQPIIFTSVADEIEPGQIASPNLDPDMNGLWGGIIVLGKAPISPKSNGTTAQIEGIPASDANGLYGGSTADDNSGTIQYVSIRHGGSNIGEGNEINGLTLGGVGSGTTIDHIEIVANQDDGIEWFGGTVNLSSVVVWNTGDDAIDTDQAWNGTVDNIVIINPGDKCFELDGPEGTYVDGNFTIKNATVLVQKAGGLVDNDDNTNGDMLNVYFYDINVTEDDFNNSIYPKFDQMPTVTSTVTNLEIKVPTSYKDGDDAEQAIPADSVTVDKFFVGTTATIVTTPTVGATTSEFATWSWAKVNNAF